MSGSIQASLSRWFAAQTFIGLSLACAAIYAITAWSFDLKQVDEFDRHVDVVAHLLQEQDRAADSSALIHKLDDFFLSHSDVGLVLSQDGKAIYSSTPKLSDAQWRWGPVTRLTDIPRAGSVTSIQVGIDVRQDAKLLERLGRTLVGAVVLGSLLVSMTGFLLVRRGLKPLQKLAVQTAETGPAYPKRRIEASPYASELLPWISQFNAVLERAEQAYHQLEAFNADVAHELRTPLANMIAEAEVELARPRTAEALREALISNLEETRRLSAIVTDMLFLSKADRGATARLSAVPVSLAGQVRDVVEFHEAELEQAGLQVRILGEARVGIDAALVRRAISNLLGNAIRYALPGSAIDVRIDVHVDAEPAQVWLAVVNRGPAIDAGALPHLFKRFYRAERSRHGSSEHHGLGLAIVAAIARMHGGETRARSSDGVVEIAFSVSGAPAAPT
ncbi:heavy metal sensor histidine kinase [Variovorax sp. RHLX14]|uniref:heavy metal sensor histidine kinase n=1 Tax=Variovorax sp. RHLX14 TaxID=1259731 RepID=UPI003F44CA1B